MATHSVGLTIPLTIALYLYLCFELYWSLLNHQSIEHFPFLVLETNIIFYNYNDTLFICLGSNHKYNVVVKTKTKSSDRYRFSDHAIEHYPF